MQTGCRAWLMTPGCITCLSESARSWLAGSRSPRVARQSLSSLDLSSLFRPAFEPFHSPSHKSQGRQSTSPSRRIVYPDCQRHICVCPFHAYLSPVGFRRHTASPRPTEFCEAALPALLAFIIISARRGRTEFYSSVFTSKSSGQCREAEAVAAPAVAVAAARMSRCKASSRSIRITA